MLPAINFIASFMRSLPHLLGYIVEGMKLPTSRNKYRLAVCI
jgi:hypothetical protein